MELEPAFLILSPGLLSLWHLPHLITSEQHRLLVKIVHKRDRPPWPERSGTDVREVQPQGHP